jgi:hypothetical protein
VNDMARDSLAIEGAAAFREAYFEETAADREAGPGEAEESDLSDEDATPAPES